MQFYSLLIGLRCLREILVSGHALLKYETIGITAVLGTGVGMEQGIPA